MKIMKNAPILLFLLFIISCKVDTKKPQHSPRAIDASKEIFNWTCQPGEKVGLISSKFTEADIIKAYGKENVGQQEISLGEGEMAMATVVFPKTENEIFVNWVDKSFKEIDEILIENPKSPWTTDQGISIGTTLEELVKINGKDFLFAGFEWDYSGFTNDWQGGNIPKNLVVFLEPADPEKVYPDLLGDSLFPSSHPKANLAKLRVRSMIIRFD